MRYNKKQLAFALTLAASVDKVLLDNLLKFKGMPTSEIDFWNKKALEVDLEIYSLGSTHRKKCYGSLIVIQKA